jgi:CRP-like cAMP-binding protein
MICPTTPLRGDNRMFAAAARNTLPRTPTARARTLAEWLEPAGVRVHVSRNAAIFWEGDQAQHCYRILSGAVRISKMLSDGRRQVADFLLPGDLVGLDRDETQQFSAEAIVDSVLVKYPRRRVEAILGDNPRAQSALLSLALERLSAAQAQMLLLARKSAEERLASFLIGLAERTGSKAVVEISMSRTDIADYLGLTIETVSRSFAKLKRDGVIALPHPQRVQLLNIAALRNLADGCGQ